MVLVVQASYQQPEWTAHKGTNNSQDQNSSQCHRETKWNETPKGDANISMLTTQLWAQSVQSLWLASPVCLRLPNHHLTFDPHDLQILISSSLSGTECLCTIWFKSFSWFSRYSLTELYIQEIKVDPTWPWPLTPWPLKPNQFIYGWYWMPVYNLV